MTAVERLRREVRDRAGLDFTGARDALFTAGLARAAADAREPDAESYARRVLAGELPDQPFVGAVTVGETWFFRDAAQWAFVEEVVLPDALARRGREGRIRAWSAGCSTGEEPYSLAMVLAERGLLDRAEIVGTMTAATLLEAAGFHLRRLEGARPRDP